MSNRSSQARYDPATDEIEDEDRNPPRRVAIVPTKALVPLCGVCCLMLSCYCKAPACIGCYSKSWFCCCNEEAVCCKPTKEPGYNCVCCRAEFLTGECPALCQMEQQCFCSDLRCACPQSPYGFPCILTCCFYTCCYKWDSVCKCCASIGFIMYYVGGATQREKASRMQRAIESSVSHESERSNASNNTRDGGRNRRAAQRELAVDSGSSRYEDSSRHASLHVAEVELLDSLSSPPMAEVLASAPAESEL